MLGSLTLAVASHNLHLVGADKLLPFTELHVLQHERPDVVTKSVGAQMAGFEREPTSNASCQRVVDGFVELQKDSQRELLRDLSRGDQLIQGIL